MNARRGSSATSRGCASSTAAAPRRSTLTAVTCESRVAPSADSTHAKSAYSPSASKQTLGAASAGAHGNANFGSSACGPRQSTSTMQSRSGATADGVVGRARTSKRTPLSVHPSSAVARLGGTTIETSKDGAGPCAACATSCAAQIDAFASARCAAKAACRRSTELTCSMGCYMVQPSELSELLLGGRVGLFAARFGRVVIKACCSKYQSLRALSIESR